MSSGVAAKDVSFAPGAGETFAGHYRVEGVLGTGGMGVVLAALDLRSGEKVAIKLLRAAEEQRAVDRFFREAKAMSRLSTEHVVRILEEGTADERPFLVMERLEGKDFAEQARGGRRLPMQAVVDAIVQACEALSHAHTAGIIHRDLKPSNLFLHAPADGRPVVKLLDFGISKVKSKEEWEKTLTATNDGGVLGSPPYMSPEQVRDPKKVDARSDVWALGIVMYKLLSGKLPFDGESVGEIFARVLERPYPSLRTWGGVDVPPELDAIVARCLTKDRRERWQNTGELALALSAFASPPWAALAHATAQRMKDDPPTVDDPGLRIDSAHMSTGEPSTLDGQDPGVFGPVVPTPYDGVPMVVPTASASGIPGVPSAMTPHSGIQALHPSMLVPGTGGGAMGPQRPLTASTFGPAVMAPRYSPASVPPATGPRPSSMAASVLAVVALVVLVGGLVLVKLPRGARGATTTTTTPPSSAPSASAPPPAESVAVTSSAPPSTSVAVSPATSVSAPIASVTASPGGRVGGRKPGGRNGAAPVGAAPSGAAGAGSGSATTTAAPSARPELHDNPYLHP